MFDDSTTFHRKEHPDKKLNSKVIYFDIKPGLPQTLCVKEKNTRPRGGQSGQPP